MPGKTPPNDPMTPNERRKLLIVLGSCVVAVAVGLTVWQLTGTPSNYGSSGNGCVNVMLPSSTGGGLQHACGDQARVWCDTAYQQNNSPNREIQKQCALAGFQRRD